MSDEEEFETIAGGKRGGGKGGDKLGDLIDRSGVVDANPWGDHFGVRGFHGQQ